MSMKEMYVSESCRAVTANPWVQEHRVFNESTVGDIPLPSLKSVFPMLRVLTAEKLTKNCTYYPEKSLSAGFERNQATGFASLVQPYPKPIIREHRLSDKIHPKLGKVQEADKPMGRVVWGEFTKSPLESLQRPTESIQPGYVHGTGYIRAVAMISTQEGIEGVLGKAYHTVSLGSVTSSVTESISGKDLVNTDVEDMPKYNRGDVVEGKLSYWRMGPIRARELSFVNEPSDDDAGVINGRENIGEEELQLLVGHKRVGADEFYLFDPVTNKEFCSMEGLWAQGFQLVDSIVVAENATLVTEATSSPSIQHETGASIMEKITHLEALKTLHESLKDSLTQGSMVVEYIDMFLGREKLLDAIDEKFVTNEENRIVFADAAKFAECSDKATVLVGEWNEQAAKLAVTSYLMQEGQASTVDSASKKLTVAELYGALAPKDKAAVETQLTLGEFKALDATTFVGENQTVPIVNLETACVAAQLGAANEGLIRAYGLVNEKAFQLVRSSIEGLDFPETLVDSAEKVDTLLASVESLAAVYGLGRDAKEVARGFHTFLTAIKESPAALQFLAGEKIDIASITFATAAEGTSPVGALELDEKFLVEAYKQKEDANKTREHLALAVGVLRQTPIDRETAEKLKSAYMHLGPAVLESLLAASIKDKVVKENATVTEGAQVVPAAIQQGQDNTAPSSDAQEGQDIPKGTAVEENVLSNWKKRMGIKTNDNAGKKK